MAREQPRTPEEIRHRTVISFALEQFAAKQQRAGPPTRARSSDLVWGRSPQPGAPGLWAWPPGSRRSAPASGV